MVDFYEIQQNGNAIEGDLHAIHFNPVGKPFKNGGCSNF
jgi:hypothetical protein